MVKNAPEQGLRESGRNPVSWEMITHSNHQKAGCDQKCQKEPVNSGSDH
jgi:hypothetical protein